MAEPEQVLPPTHADLVRKIEALEARVKAAEDSGQAGAVAELRKTIALLHGKVEKLSPPAPAVPAAAAPPPAPAEEEEKDSFDGFFG